MHFLLKWFVVDTKNIRKGMFLKIDRDEWEYGRYIPVTKFHYFLKFMYFFRIGGIPDILPWFSIFLCFCNFSTFSAAEKLMMRLIFSEDRSKIVISEQYL